MDFPLIGMMPHSDCVSHTLIQDLIFLQLIFLGGCSCRVFLSGPAAVTATVAGRVAVSRRVAMAAEDTQGSVFHSKWEIC